MIVTRRAFALGAFVSVAGCTLPQQQYQDPLTGLYNLSASSVPADVPAKAGPTIALVLGSNIDKLLQHREDIDKTTTAISWRASDRLKDQDPQYLLTSAVQILHQRYPNLDKAEDLATVARHQIKSSIVLDVVVAAGPSSGQKTTATVIAVFFDDKQMPISRIDASGQATVGYPYFANIKAASDIALAGFRQKVEQYWS